jgi:Phage tail tube protein
VTATTFVPDTSINLTEDPGLFYPAVMMGQRDTNIFGVYGQYKVSGTVAAPLFPTNGIPLLVGALGTDGATANAGNTGTTTGTQTTLAASVASGASVITLTASTGFAAGNVIQIDVNSSVGPTTSELTTITTLTGTSATVGPVLQFTHASAASVQKVIAPFTHNITQKNVLSSYTVEQNEGGYESLQFTGCRVNKFGIKTDATNTEANFSADLMGQAATVLTTPTAITVVNEEPFVFAEAAVSLFGTSLNQVTNFSMDIENGLKDSFTLNGNHTLQFLTATTRHVSGQFDVIWNSFDDATYGYWNKMFSASVGSISFSLTHPSNGGSISLTLPQVKLAKYADSIKMNDVVITTLSYEAELQLSNLTTITCTVQNGVSTYY